MKLNTTATLCLLLSVCSAAELKYEETNSSATSSPPLSPSSSTERPRGVKETYFRPSETDGPQVMYTRKLASIDEPPAALKSSASEEENFQALEQSFAVRVEEDESLAEVSEKRRLRFIVNGKLAFPLVRMALERRKDLKDHAYSESIIQSLPPISDLALPSLEELPETELAYRDPVSLNAREREILSWLLDSKRKWKLSERVPLFEFACKIRQAGELNNYSPVLLKRMADELVPLKEAGLDFWEQYKEKQQVLTDKLQKIIKKLKADGIVQLSHGRADKLKDKYLSTYGEAMEQRDKFLRANWLPAIKEIQLFSKRV